jgi:hypothetical protein
MDLLYPAKPVLGIYRRVVSQHTEAMPAYPCNAALLTIAKPWHQLRCPTTDEWIKKMWYIYLLFINKEQIYATFRKMDGAGDHHVE